VVGTVEAVPDTGIPLTDDFSRRVVASESLRRDTRLDGGNTGCAQGRCLRTRVDVVARLHPDELLGLPPRELGLPLRELPCIQGLTPADFEALLRAPLGILGCGDLGAHSSVSHPDADAETDTEDRDQGYDDCWPRSESGVRLHDSDGTWVALKQCLQTKDPRSRR
jgi:hypothetical protein